MKKFFTTIICVILILSMCIFTGCSQADRVSYNLSKEADNFNEIRRLTFINCISGETLFEITGKMSINVDEVESQLEIVAEDGEGDYQKHFVALNPVMTYVCEDISAKDVSNTKFTINFNPDMAMPVDITTIE